VSRDAQRRSYQNFAARVGDLGTGWPEFARVEGGHGVVQAKGRKGGDAANLPRK